MNPSPALLATLGLMMGPAIRAQENAAPDPAPSAQEVQTANREPGDRPRPPKPSAKRPDKPATEKPGSVKSAKRTYLGLSSRPLDSVLHEHLDIPEGFGIQVVEVVPDSPAAAAGILPNDILLRLEDQRLISPEHLSLLVRSLAAGDRVPLTVVRKGREQIIEVALGETDEILFGHFGPHPQAPPQLRGMPDWNEEARRQQEFWQKWMERHHPDWRQGNPQPRNRPGEPMPPQDPGTLPPGATLPGVKVNPGFPLRVFGTEGVLKIDNEQGELTLTRKGKDHHLVIEDADGQVIFDGAYDPKAGVAGLPEEARAQLDKMKLGDLEIRLPEAPPVSPKKTSKPDPELPGEPESGVL